MRVSSKIVEMFQLSVSNTLEPPEADTQLSGFSFRGGGVLPTMVARGPAVHCPVHQAKRDRFLHAWSETSWVSSHKVGLLLWSFCLCDYIKNRLRSLLMIRFQLHGWGPYWIFFERSSPLYSLNSGLPRPRILGNSAVPVLSAWVLIPLAELLKRVQALVA